MVFYCSVQIRNIFTYLMYKVFFSFTVSSDFYRPFIANKTTHLLSTVLHSGSKLHKSFEIQWVRHYLINHTDFSGIVNATVYKTEPILGVRAWKVVLIFNTVIAWLYNKWRGQIANLSLASFPWDLCQLSCISKWLDNDNTFTYYPLICMTQAYSMFTSRM